MDDLERQRVSILDEIDRIHQHPSPDGGVDEELNSLKEQYNRIVIQIEEIETIRFKDPLESLPLELWQDIIRLCCPFPYESSKMHVDSLLHLTLVSKEWQAAILSTPAFWSKIDIARDMEDMEAKLAACITLSADLPLNIKLEILTELSPASLQALRDQSIRIKSLWFEDTRTNSPQYPDDRAQNFIKEFVSSLGPLNSLGILHCSVYRGIPQNIDPVLEQATNIRGLHRIDLTPITLALPSLQTLRLIYCTNPFTTLLPSLDSLPYLKVVSFAEPHTNENPLQPEEIQKSCAAFGQREGALPWLHLTVRQVDVGDISPILPRVSDTLLKLSVMVSWDSLATLLSTCGQMKRLQDLTILLPTTSELVFRPKFANIRSTDIQKLALDFGSSAPGLRSPDDETTTRDSIKHLFEIIVTFAPKVQDLYIHTYIPQTPNLAFSQGLPHLNTVKFRCLWKGSFENSDLLLPEVKTVDMSLGGSILSSICCPKAVKLSLFFSEVLYFNLIWCSHVSYLEVRGGRPEWKGVFFPNLEKLTIETSDPFNANCNPTQLLVELALRPTAFPRLEYLGIEFPPEWDILFIMLERRNFSRDKNISSIKTLKLSSDPGILLRRALSDRLRGVFSERPSNFSLSLQGIAPIYMDANIKGCDRCHRAFQPCEEEPVYALSTAKPFHEPLLYPRTAEEILATSESRAVAWNERKIRRPLWCNRHYGSSKVSIGKYNA